MTAWCRCRLREAQQSRRSRSRSRVVVPTSQRLLINAEEVRGGGGGCRIVWLGLVFCCPPSLCLGIWLLSRGVHSSRSHSDVSLGLRGHLSDSEYLHTDLSSGYWYSSFGVPFYFHPRCGRVITLEWRIWMRPVKQYQRQWLLNVSYRNYGMVQNVFNTYKNLSSVAGLI